MDKIIFSKWLRCGGLTHGFDGGDGWDSGSGSGRSGGWYRGGGIVVEVTFSNGTTLVIGVVHFVALWWQVVVILTSVTSQFKLLKSVSNLNIKKSDKHDHQCIVTDINRYLFIYR